MPQNTIVPPLSELHKVFFWLFIAIFFMLLFLGGKPATAPYVVSSQVFTFLYFFYFFLVIPLIPEVEFVSFRLRNLLNESIETLHHAWTCILNAVLWSKKPMCPCIFFDIFLNSRLEFSGYISFLKNNCSL